MMRNENFKMRSTRRESEARNVKVRRERYESEDYSGVKMRKGDMIMRMLSQ